MKKALCILLTLAMLFTLFSCAAKKDDNSTVTTGTVGNADDNSGSAQSDGTIPIGGEILSGDHSAREPYKIAYIVNQLTLAFNKSISDSMANLAGTMNYEYTVFEANNDFEAYVNQIYALADDGYEGFVFGVDDSLAMTAYRAGIETGVSFIMESTPVLDDDGLRIWPSIEQDQVGNGAMCVQWLYDNYATYWGEGSLEGQKLGLIGIDGSMVSGIHARRAGVESKFNELFPDGTYFEADQLQLGNLSFSIDGNIQLCTQIFSQNPDVDKWFVVGFIDDWAVGATRAAEQMGIEDKVLVTSVQADQLLNELNSGYTGSVYVAACAISPNEFAINFANYLIATLDGTVTPENAWPGMRDDGDLYSHVAVEGMMITKDNYQDYVAVQGTMLP